MCKVADAAKLMINHAIDLAKRTNDPRYYADFYKLHKLLYYAQGYMLTHYGKHLFEEDVEAHNCGVLIPKLLDLPIDYDAITKKFDENDILPLTSDRVEAIDHTLSRYGSMSKDELVNQCRNDPVYRKCASAGSPEGKTVIPKETMAAAKDVFDPDV